jgi:phosphohistidine phosphatase SixA
VTTFVLVRHASAGSRRDWRGDDRLRPLDARGEKQAQRLVAALETHELDRIATSPYVRCVQTVQSLGEARGIEVEERSELAEGASRAATLALIDELGGSSFLLCTHGDVIEELLRDDMKKGELRIVELRGAEVRAVG